MDEILNVKTNDGQLLEIKVIKKFKIEAYPDKEYVAYTFGEVTDDMVQSYVSSVKKSENDYFLESINDTEEWNLVQAALQEILLSQEN